MGGLLTQWQASPRVAGAAMRRIDAKAQDPPFGAAAEGALDWLAAVQIGQFCALSVVRVRQSACSRERQLSTAGRSISVTGDE